MNNFTYKNPTKIIFGKGQISAITNEIPVNAKILLLYGGGSIKTNGIYEQVTVALQSFDVVEFSGITANPEYEKLMEAVAVIQANDIDCILAVGGGSVIDGAKFIAAASKYNGDAWDMVKNRGKITEALPIGTVLTLPATGSEMNAGFVISRRETKEKLAMGNPLLFPVFSVLDPTVVQSIPKKQLVNGVVDAFNHVLEQYVTYPVGATLQDRFAESILQTLLEEGPKVVDNPNDETATANFMWSCTMALNGLIAQGVPTDWAVHSMGHELTALYGIDHARTLAIVGPSHYTYFLSEKLEKLAQLGRRVFGMSSDDNEVAALQTIQALEDFYSRLEVSTKLSAYTDAYEGTAQTIAQRFTDRGWLGMGEKAQVTPKDVEKIIEMCY